MHDSTSEEDRRMLQEMVGRAGPSFIRRAKLVETTWTALLDACARARREKLTFVRLRLGQLRALAGDWAVLQNAMPSADEFEFLVRLHDELQPRLRVPLNATESRRALRNAAFELIEAMEMFNGRWTRWLAKVDLTTVNRAREDYNRYFLFEKECAVGSPRVARMGFAMLTPKTLMELTHEFPLLPVPQFNF
jgi:hypothetical protein